MTSATEYATTDLSSNATVKGSVYCSYRSGSDDVQTITRYANGVSDKVTLTYGSFAAGAKPGYVYSEKLGTAALLDYTYDTMGRMTGKTVAGNQTYGYTYKAVSGNRTTPPWYQALPRRTGPTRIPTTPTGISRRSCLHRPPAAGQRPRGILTMR